ncbi:NOL1/NOP2/sun family [Novymonas esmeraldas]|uniref:NOL1/NOP2/sun family n=1 Tax=Novymonas esmeraldas TaxID=1808958 RepID=A0AAW0F3W9_9TRYP
MPAPKNKLKSFGKNRREVRPPTTTYDEDGHWVGTPHQDRMRLVENSVFDRYYNTLQQLGGVVARTVYPASLTSLVSSSSAALVDAQQPVPADVAAALWAKEMEQFRTPLLTTFWINDTDPLAARVRAHMEAQDVSLVEPIPWYPIAGMGWRILADKTEFRKRPEMQSLRQYLIRQTALGTISRQEEVSMIPPFLLDIQPNDVCLDMCASPGSKTAQMLVALGRHKAVPFDSDASPFPFDYDSDGLVIANELDTKRANMLVHQVKRLRLLFPFALFTNHDARYFPEIAVHGPPSDAEAAAAVGGGAALRFDKILCDVVCSGDGTLRKAPHIFNLWTPKEAINLQKLQIQIALRACHLLRVGGRLVYSTCSLNPVENEAVVAQIVHRTRGAMRLVDARALLPGLPCAPGMSSWTVTDAKGRVYATPEGNMHEALFPPHTPGAYTSPAVDAVDLSLCMRLFPSHCRGGGFFVAVLDKVSEFRLKKLEELRAEEAAGDAAEKDAETAAEESEDASGRAASPKREKKESDVPAADADADADAAAALEAELADAPEPSKPRSLPPQFVGAPEEMQRTITGFYAVSDFPMSLLFVRTAQGERELRLSAGSVCSLVSRMAARVLRHKTDSTVIVSAGLRVLAFESLDKGWRIASESALLFAKLMRDSPRLVRVPVAFIQDMVAVGGKLKEKMLESIDDAALRDTIEGLPLGTVLLEIDAPNALGGVFYSVALRARSRVQLLVDHEDLEGMQLRLGEEPRSPAEGTSTDKSVTDA